MSDYDDLSEDTLFIALTRPATVLGVPYGGLILNFMISVSAFIGTTKLMYLFLGLPLFHLLMYAVCYKDINIFDTLFSWLRTNLRCRNRFFWGMASFSPESSAEKNSPLSKIVKN